MTFASIKMHDDIAVIEMDQEDSPVNVLSLAMLNDFSQLLDKIENDNSIRAAVLISAKPDTFIAGADIEGFSKMADGEALDMSRNGNILLSRMANMQKTIVAAIDGPALGGGLEVAMACHYRIATTNKKTVLGLPEVKLGLLPGGGGTQRLPALVGLRPALDIILTGKNVYPFKAKKIGLVDALIHPPGLLQAAIAAARDGMRSRPRKPGLMDRLLDNTKAGRNMVFKKARETLQQKTGGNYPAPFEILECVRIGVEKGLRKGLEAESEGFARLQASTESKQLVGLFLAMQGNKYFANADKARQIDGLAMIGAGFMGAGIAQVSCQNGIDIILKDVSEKSLGQAQQTIWKDLGKAIRRRVMSGFDRDVLLSKIQYTVDDDALATSALVVEAVFEDVALKQKILATVEAGTGSDTIFASNTSSLPLADIGKNAKRPAQLVGMHYFSPVPKMPLLEVVVTDKTADWVVATVVKVGIRQGKTVIVVKDGPGFYTTRILSAYMNEALELLDEGAKIEEIDRAMKAFGFPVGPMALMDEVGIDVGAHIARGALAGLFKSRKLESKDITSRMSEDGLHGRKTAKGFYLYKGRKKRVNPKAYQYTGSPDRKAIAHQEIQERLSCVMVNEAVHCLQDKVLSKPVDGDLGAILGLGFPPFLGGPFRYLDQMGIQNFKELLEKHQKTHGNRFKPARRVNAMAKSGKKFY